MATIVKKPRKDGVAYLFQVKLTSPLTAKKLVKTKTWNPPKSYTQKQAEREAVILADAWEKEVRAYYNVYNPHGELTPDSTFKEVAKKWLEKLEGQGSLSHLEGSKDYIKVVLPHIGKIKVGMLTQGIIQNLFDWVDKRERVIIKVRSKPKIVRKTMKNRNETYATMINNHKINNNSICAVLNGKRNVTLDYAERFAKALDADVNLLFNITETRQPYAYNSNHKIKATVRAILSFAKKRRLVTDNYAKAEYIDFPKRTQKEIKCMDGDTLKDVYKAVQNYDDIRHVTALLTLIFTGIRRGELCGLRWESIDLENRLMSIDLNVTCVIRVGIVEKEPKTHRSKRKVELPHTLCKHLKKYKKWYYETKEQMGDRWDKKDWLFINTDTGKRIVPNTINSWINKVTMQAGLGRWTVHSYRHTNITTKLLNNVPLLEVAGEAGHSRTSTTTDQYGHFLATHKRVGPAVLDQIIGGGSK